MSALGQKRTRKRTFGGSAPAHRFRQIRSDDTKRARDDIRSITSACRTGVQNEQQNDARPASGLNLRGDLTCVGSSISSRFDLEIRCGLHTGECERVDNDLAVHCTCPLSGVTQTSRFAPQKAMSALPPTATAKADFRDLKVYSVGGPCPLWVKSRHVRSLCLLWPNCGLLDHLVGNQQKVASNHQAERFQRRAIVTPTTRKRKRRRDAKSANQ